MPSASSASPSSNPDLHPGPDSVGAPNPPSDSAVVEAQRESEPDSTPSGNTQNNENTHESSDVEESDLDLAPHRFDDDIENDEEHVTPPAIPTGATSSNDVPIGSETLTPVNSRKRSNPPADVSAIKPSSLPTRSIENGDANNDNNRLRARISDLADDASDMLSKLTRSPLSASKFLSDWLAGLTTNGPASVASILSLVVAIGRPIGPHVRQQLVSPEMIVANQPALNVSDFTSILSSDPHARVPILAKDAQSKRVRKAYEELWCRLPADASNVVIFDTDCVETLVSWLEPMACSASRGLRTAACYAVYRMVDGFLTVRIRLQRDLASMQRQLSSERTKQGGMSTTLSKSSRSKEKPLSAKGKELARKVEELSANIAELDELCDKVFRSVFVLKYRDVSPDIRGMSVKALGGWISTFPRQFLDDIHLKYVGWLLYDKDAGVRRSTLDVVRSILMKKELLRGLNSFLGRFCSRIVEMSRDKDDSVAVSAINVLTQLEIHGLIDQKSCEIVCAIAVEETQVGIRRAAGEFLANMIIRRTPPESPSTPSGRKTPKPASQKGRRAMAIKALEKLGDVPSFDVSREHIRHLLSVTSQRKSEHAQALVVDAVWDYLPALRCWDAFTSLLVDRSELFPLKSSNSSGASSQNSTGSASAPTNINGLNDNDKVSLCEILVASAIEANGKGDKARASLIVQRGDKGTESISQHFTRYMVPELPKILTHFQADGQVMKFLVQLPKHFRIEALEQESCKPHLKSLLNRLVDALTRHSGERGVALACSDTFRSLLSDDNPLKASTMMTLQLTCKKATKEFCVSVLSGLIDIEPETVSASLLRLRVLTELVEPSVSILDPLLKLLRHQVEKGNNSKLSDEVTSDGVRIIIGLVVWSLLKIRSRLDSMDTVNANLSTILETNDILDAQERGAEIITHILEMCECEHLSPYVNAVSLQGLLTTMTLCCGIERLLAKRLESSESSPNSAEMKLKNEMDLLDLKARRDVLAEAVKLCVFAMIENECISMNAQFRTRRRDEITKSTSQNDGAVKHCMGALLQACVQSIISKEICHLPMLGLLLKGKRGRHVIDDNDVSIVSMCRQYYELRIMRESLITEEEIRLLLDCGSMERSKERSMVTSRGMAEVLVSFRRRDTDRNSVSLHILRVLVDWIVDEDHDVATIVSGVRTLCNVGAGLLGYLTEETAQRARQKLKAVEEFLRKDWIVEECGEVEASVEGLVKALETIKEHGSGQSSKLTLNESRKGLLHSKNDDKNDTENDEDDAVTSDMEEGEHVVKDISGNVKSCDLPANTATRRSSRHTSRINYSTLNESENNEFEIREIVSNGEEAVETNGEDCHERDVDAMQVRSVQEDRSNIEPFTNAIAAEAEPELENGVEDVLKPKAKPVRTMSTKGNDSPTENHHVGRSEHQTQARNRKGEAESDHVKKKGRKKSDVIPGNTGSKTNIVSDLAPHICSSNDSREKVGEVTHSLGEMGDGRDSDSIGKTLPPRRSKRRRSDESGQLVEDITFEGKSSSTKRPRTPRSTRALRTNSMTKNASIEGVDEVNIGQNGIRTRSAAKASRDSVAVEAETTPSRLVVRRRKRHHW